MVRYSRKFGDRGTTQNRQRPLTSAQSEIIVDTCIQEYIIRVVED